ncbi:hypothetical protein PQY66_00045 [Luminiphilus sp.]|nr:hypothetical protein [Luminiphilus sp.]
MWMWIAVLALFYVIGVIGPLWTLLAGLAFWFVVLPLLAVVITFLNFAQEAEKEEHDGPP